MIRNLQENFENKLDSKQNSINEIVKQERKRKTEKGREKPYQTLPVRPSPPAAQQIPAQHGPDQPNITLRLKNRVRGSSSSSQARGRQHEDVLVFSLALARSPRSAS
jgi:hypothetical protein